MKKEIFLSGKKEELFKLKQDIEQELQSIEEGGSLKTALSCWAERLEVKSTPIQQFKEQTLDSSSSSLKEVGGGSIDEKLENTPSMKLSLARRLKRLFLSWSIVEEAERNSEEVEEVYPLFSKGEPVFYYEIRGAGIFTYMPPELVELIEGSYEKLKYQLRRRLRALERSIKRVTRELEALVRDKRAYFRSIVKLLFKNMDDEHVVVNNLEKCVFGIIPPLKQQDEIKIFKRVAPDIGYTATCR